MPSSIISPKERAFLASCETVPATSLPHLVGGELESAGSGDLAIFFSQFDDEVTTLGARPAAYADGLRSVCTSALRGARRDLEVRAAFFDVLSSSDFVFGTSQVPPGFDRDADPVLPFAVLRGASRLHRPGHALPQRPAQSPAVLYGNASVVRGLLRLRAALVQAPWMA